MHRTFTDQLGRSISLNERPKRVISIVPSQTEYLWDLGLDDEVVGITKFCIHPNDWFRNKERVGGTKTLNFEKIRELQPDLIIANKEENTQAEIEQLAKEFQVWISDIYTLDDACEMMISIGQIFDELERAQAIVANIRDGFESLGGLSDKRVLYFIWHGPMMCAGGNTFIDDMLTSIGLTNVASSELSLSRYPELSKAQIRESNPDAILLSSEPYPFKDKHIAEFRALVPTASIHLVDGEMFSWYGSRLLKAPSYYKELLSALQ